MTMPHEGESIAKKSGNFTEVWACFNFHLDRHFAKGLVNFK